MDYTAYVCYMLYYMLYTYNCSDHPRILPAFSIKSLQLMILEGKLVCVVIVKECENKVM